jgi:hypothetical protein
MEIGPHKSFTPILDSPYVCFHCYSYYLLSKVVCLFCFSCWYYWDLPNHVTPHRGFGTIGKPFPSQCACTNELHGSSTSNLLHTLIFQCSFYSNYWLIKSNYHYLNLSKFVWKIDKLKGPNFVLATQTRNSFCQVLQSST